MNYPHSPIVILVMAPRPPVARDRLSYDTLEGLYQGIEAQGAQVHVEHQRPASAQVLQARLSASPSPPVDILLVDAALVQRDGGAELLLEGEGQAQGLSAAGLAELISQAGVGLGLVHLQAEGVGEEALAFARAVAAQAEAPILLVRSNLPAPQAAVLMSELLAQLLAREPLAVAVESAQAALVQTERRASGSAEEQAPLALRLLGPGELRWVPTPKSMSGISQVAPWAQRDLGSAVARLVPSDAPGALPPQAFTGLLGRRRQWLELEALLAPEQGPPVWVYGYDGIGKTALVSHVARWLVRTGRFARVVYSSLARSGSPALPLYDLGQTLLGPSLRVDENAETAVLAALQETPTLILWDDFNTVLPGGEFGTRADALGEWYRLASQLAAVGPSRLCLLSDGPALPESARRLPEVLNLEIPLLSEEDAAALLARLWQGEGGPSPEPATLRPLAGALGGHPLTLQLLAAQFSGVQPEAAVEQLLAELPDLATGGARFRNEALEILFERLLKGLPPALRHAVPHMGLFVGGFPRHIGLGLMELEEALWEEQAPSLARAGLLREAPIADLTIPYVRMHPALKRLARQRLDQHTRQQLATTFGRQYLVFLGWLLRSRERGPQSVAAISYHDLGNMGIALDLLLEAQDLVSAANYGRLYTEILEMLGLEQEARRVTAQVQEATNQAVPHEGSLGRPGVQLLWDQADRLVEAGELAPASTLLRQLLDRMNTQGGLNYIGTEADLDRARTLSRLGRTLRSARQYEAALAALRRGANLLDDLEAEDSVRKVRAELHAELAETLIAIGQYQEAEQECQAGLRAVASLSEPAIKGGLHARLGVIATRRHQPEEAHTHYGRALEQMRLAQDAPGMAAIETQLASLALRPPANLAQAREHLGRALDHAHQSGNPLLEGQIMVQLAQVSLQAEDHAEAESLFRHAIALYGEHGIIPGLVAAQASLAEFLLQQERLEEAQSQATSALEAAEKAGPNATPWELFLLLQRIAQRLGQQEDADRWRAATQDAFARSSQASSIRARWQPVIRAVVQGTRGETMDAEAAQTIEEMENLPDWQALGRTIQHILAGERGDELWRGLDHVDGVIVRAILEELDQGPQEATAGE